MSATISFGHYEVQLRPDGSPFELGRGAMGITYKAMDKSLVFPVALKVINGRYLNSEVARQRFVREARSAAKLRHRNVASVFHLGIEEDAYFYAMEFIDGETVESLIRREGPQTPVTVLQIAVQVARALNAAAQHGLVHRDIKPANLMLVKEDDELCVKVIDFGLVKVKENEGEDGAALSVGGFFGTPHFASPEQLLEREIDGRSDIYSLGATMWYMLAGQAPFGGTMAQVMSQQLGTPPPFEKLKGLPPGVEKLLARMLAKDAAERPQSAVALRTDLEEVLAGLTGKSLALLGAGDEQADFGTVMDNPTPALQPGAMAGGRYEILRVLGEDRAGQLFQALDQSRCDVRLISLRREWAANRTLMGRMKAEVERLHGLDHPNLLRVQSLEVSHGEALLLLEWTNGFSLLDLLRTRRVLPLAEVWPLLPQIAAGLDQAGTAGVKHEGFELAQTLVHFPNAGETGEWLRTPTTSWPNFVVKAPTLDLNWGFGRNESLMGSRTMSAESTAAASKDSASLTPTLVRAFAAMVYEMLGGAPVSTVNQAGSYTPLGALNEPGNAVMWRALESPDAFAKAADFATALRQQQEAGSHQAVGMIGSSARPLINKVPKNWSPAKPLLPAEAAKASLSAAPLPASPLPVQTPTSKTATPPPLAPVAPTPAKTSPAILFGGAAGALLLAAVGGWLVMSKMNAPTTPPLPGPKDLNNPSKTAQTEPEKKVTPSTPALPDPVQTEQELARAAVAKAQAIEAQDDLPQSVAAWVKTTKEFPHNAVSRLRLEILLNAFRNRRENPKDQPKAMSEAEFASLSEPLNDAADLGVVSAMALLGEGYRKSATVKSFHWYSAAADKGDKDSITQAGLMLSNGAGVAQDFVKAAELFEKAVNMKDPSAAAQYGLAECLLDGKGRTRDVKRGVELLEDSAAGGEVHAMDRLADCYRKGIGVTADPIKSRQLFTKAAELGYAGSMANLAVLYLNGEAGLAQDPTKALELLQKGDTLGDGFSSYLLARCLENGIGVAADPAKAEAIYKRAALARNPKAKEWCLAHGVALTP